MVSLAEEKKLFRAGYKFVAGIDEAGRGSLAGPVVAACVACSSPAVFADKALSMVDDSKKLSSKKREKLHEAIKLCHGLRISIGICNRHTIDQINILQATFLAMRKAVNNAKRRPEYLLVDGNKTIPNIFINQRAVKNGDGKIFLIAVASIIAKVTRDRLMAGYHRLYPLYRFEKHKGYGTGEHFELLHRHGACRIHRRSFEPVKTVINKQLRSF